MSKKKVLAVLGGIAIAGTGLAAKIAKGKAKETTYKADLMEPIEARKMGFYEKHIKRVIDIACATSAIVVFSPLYLGIATMVRLKHGSPVIFTQDRPGLVDKDGKETVFKMYKFRTMTDERDESGELLPDDKRLTKFGAWLRSTSLDELPEAFNILNGTMSVIGPRPQLVRDMTFMTTEQRKRHTAKPGLSGLAQVNGRNAICWEDKLAWDNEYIKRIGFIEDAKIVLATVKKAFIKKEGIVQTDMATAEDYGDYLLRTEIISLEQYKQSQKLAKSIIDKKKNDSISKQILNYDFSVSMCVYDGDEPIAFEKAIESVVEQTLKPKEIVLVVDGPIGTQLNSVILSYKSLLLNTDISFKVIYLSENKGHGEARRICLENCSCELIALMDADDLSTTDRFEKQVQFFINNKDVSAVGGQIVEFVGDMNNRVGQRVVPLDDKSIKEYMKRRCPMNQVTVMFKKADIMSVGGYIDWYCEEDYYLWLRLALAGYRFGNVADNLVFVRVGEEMYGRRGGKKYFLSEAKLQSFMLKNGMISTHRYLINVIERFVLQVVMPNRIRGILFQKLARRR